jgi:hypothetical protein
MSGEGSEDQAVSSWENGKVILNFTKDDEFIDQMTDC